MGNVNAQSLPQLQKETLLGYYDAILHVGDFAYNMDDVITNRKPYINLNVYQVDSLFLG